MTDVRAAIFGFKNNRLLPEEISFFSDVNPWGYIVFQRNIENPDQLRRLTDQLRSVAGREDVPILIDQEGGRVRRLKPPHWREHPAVGKIAELAERELGDAKRAAYIQARIIANDLYDVGVNVNCAPTLDVLIPGASDIIGDRSYGSDVEIIAMLGREAVYGFLDGGVLPIVKHIPGHGRALVDSHEVLPIVPTVRERLEDTDFAPFRQLASVKMAMTAHIVYEDIDPAQPCTWSETVITEVIRQSIGFNGLLMSDDVSMEALEGPYNQRTAKVFSAGCDLVLHCNGDLGEMREIAEATPVLTGISEVRARAALDELATPKPVDIDALQAELDDLIG